MWVSIVFLDGKSNKDGYSRQNHNNIGYIDIAIPTMVPNDPEDEDKESSPSPKVAKTAKKYLRRVSSIDKNKNTKTCSIDFFAKQLVAKGISKTASEFFTNSRKKGTTSTYKSTLKNCVSWCHQ